MLVLGVLPALTSFLPSIPFVSVSNSDDKATRKGGILFLGIAIGAALTFAGGAASYFVVGPKIVRAKIDGIVAEAVGQAIECAVHVDAAASPAQPRAVHEINNLVTNPAGSSGYLMVSVGVEVENAEEVELVKAAEVALRDGILRILSSKTPSELTGQAARDALGQEIAALVEQNVRGAHVTRILFPQFVVQ